MFGLKVAAEVASWIFFKNCSDWPPFCVEQDILLHGFFSD